MNFYFRHIIILSSFSGKAFLIGNHASAVDPAEGLYASFPVSGREAGFKLPPPVYI
jgi:hypothetical protein